MGLFSVGSKPSGSQSSLSSTSTPSQKPASEKELRELGAVANALNEKAKVHEAAAQRIEQNVEVLKDKVTNMQPDLDAASARLLKLQAAKEKAAAKKAEILPSSNEGIKVQ